MLFTGVARGVGVVPPPRAAESKWRQSDDKMNIIDQWFPKCALFCKQIIAELL
jgi:hypothetical protein